MLGRLRGRQLPARAAAGAVLRKMSAPQASQPPQAAHARGLATGGGAKQQPPILSTVEDFRAARSSLTGTVGFVPTMGALHDGHLSLFRAARAECDAVVASIFVNPAQFAPHEDFDQYPRQLQKDVELLSAENLVDLVFAPTREAMYSPHHITYVDPQGMEALSEGAARPGFFRGVATVVTKLFNVVQPTRAYFGQKDALQCVVIKRMVDDLNFPLKICVLPTARESDGLAMSSRNAYLKPHERAAAPIVHRALLAARDAWSQRTAGGGAAKSGDIAAAARSVLTSEPLVSAVEYVSVASRDTMEEVAEAGVAGCVVSVALKLGSVRLIDNMVFGPED